MSVHAVDVSPVAIRLANDLAASHGLDDRCRFDVFDLDEGLPPGPQVDLVFCHLFRAPSLYEDMVERLRPGGLLALVVRSDVDGEASRHNARGGELRRAFGHLEVEAEREGAGIAWILARRPYEGPGTRSSR